MIDEKISKFLFHKYRITFFPKVTHQVNPLGLEAMLEDNTQHTPCNFMPLGSYSYSQSFFPNVRRIGRYCSIGSNVEVMGASHPTDWISSSPVFYRKRRARMWGSHREDFPDFSDVGDQVEIGDNVWIGDGVLLKRGVNIGTGAIVAAAINCD